MNETKFKVKLLEGLQKRLQSYDVKKDENLIYKVIVNEDFKFKPDNSKEPKRGDYAFQTDLLITRKKNQLPLVVIETKWGGFSTHDVLTYSTKAQRHKEIYPYLRYGFVVGGTNVIHNRFFTHNIGFDFAFALDDLNDNSVTELAEIVNQQIENAESLSDVLRNKNQTRKFNTKIVIEKRG